MISLKCSRLHYVLHLVRTLILPHPYCDVYFQRVHGAAGRGRVKLVAGGPDILETSPPGQRAAARSVLTGKGVFIVTNGLVSHSVSLPWLPASNAAAHLYHCCACFCHASVCPGGTPVKNMETRSKAWLHSRGAAPEEPVLSLEHQKHLGWDSHEATLVLLLGVGRRARRWRAA